jgi:hypothetical protein
MNIRNYTSNIDSAKSISLIEKSLVEVGAIKISKDYKDGKISGILFQIIINQQPLIFKLPSRSETIYKLFSEQIKKPRKHTLDTIRDQSERTAWKLLYEWVQIQISMIRLEQIEILEVFLPYVYNIQTEKTLFEKIKESNFKLLSN